MKSGARGFRLTALIFTALFIFAVTGCQKKGPVKTETPQAIPVKVAKVELHDINKTLDYIGNIKAQDEAMVYPKVSGKIIEKVKEDGSVVDRGDIIAYIDRDEVGLKFEKAPVTSPLKGIVGRFNADIGSNVTPQTPVALVIDMDKVKIGLDIPEKYLADVSLGQKADIYVDAYLEEKFSGEVTKISPVIDLVTRTMPVEITIENQDHRLKSGMFARVSLVIKEIKDAALVLKEAVMGREPDLYVYTVENGKAVLKDVELGIRQNGYFEIKNGLKQGDTVVVMGQQRLRDGAEVRAEEENIGQKIDNR